MSDTAAPNPTSTKRPMQIGRLLEENGLVSEQQIQQALAFQKERGNRKLLGEVLIELGFVTEEQVAECLAQAHDLPFAAVGPGACDPMVIDRLPKDFVEKQNVLPMFCVNDTLTVAVHEPSNVYLIEELQRLHGGSVQLVVSTADAIRDAIRANTPSADVFVIDDLVDEASARDLDVVNESVNELVDMEEIAGQSPVVKMVNFLVFSAVEESASDIHIEPDENNLRVRYRVDGRLYEKICPPASMHAAIVSRIKIMAALDISERRAPQDGSIRVMLGGRPIDLRVSTMPGRFGEKVVIRIIDNAALTPCLEKTGMDVHVLNEFKQTLSASHGIVLVTGPTGSGKSTTLYAMLDAVKSDEINISTVEDPVEYNMPGVNQFQTNDK
ncbi:MAG: GspE/PulE family protein, partial [Planctomycetota bacterium]